MSEFHLRVSVEHKNATKVIDAFVGKFKPTRWICCYENKNMLACKYYNYDDKTHNHEKCEWEGHIDEPYEKNPHIHTYLEYSKAPTKQQVSEFFKSQPILKVGKVAGYYHREQTKTTEENIIYTTKCNHFVSVHGYTKDDLDKYKVKNEEINENKKLSSRDKLLNEWNKKSGYLLPATKFEIFKFIDEIYTLKYEKSPLAIGHKISYSIYIIMKIYDKIENKTAHDKIRYDAILHDLYNIKYDSELHQIKEICKAAEEYNNIIDKKNKIMNEISWHENLNTINNADFIDDDEEDDEKIWSKRQYMIN